MSESIKCFPDVSAHAPLAAQDTVGPHQDALARDPGQDGGHPGRDVLDVTEQNDGIERRAERDAQRGALPEHLLERPAVSNKSPVQPPSRVEISRPFRRYRGDRWYVALSI